MELEISMFNQTDLVPVYHLQWEGSQAKHYRGQQASIRPSWTLNDFIYSFPRRVYYLFPRSRPTPPQGTAHNWVFVWCRFDTAERHNGHIKQIAVTGGGGGGSVNTNKTDRETEIDVGNIRYGRLQ